MLKRSAVPQEADSMSTATLNDSTPEGVSDEAASSTLDIA